MFTVIAKIETEAFMPVCRQTELFLLSVLLGGGFGVLYDAFRALRAVFPAMSRAVPTAVCDILYFLLCGMGIYLFSLKEAGGAVRGYYWLGAFLGAAIYLLTAGTVIIGVIRAVSAKVYRVLGHICRLISSPAVKAYKKITTKKNGKFVANAEKMSQNCKN